MKKKVIIYARVSTREQANSGYSLKMQIERVKQYFTLYSDDSNPIIEEALEKASQAGH